MNEGSDEGLRAFVAPRDGRPTLRMCYLFSGPQRKSSIAQHLKKLCERSGFGLECEEIDILIKGNAHDILDKEVQEKIMSKIAAGDYDIVVLSPPCATWSRARWSNGDGPGPVRNRRYPWGIPHLEFEWQKRHARNGNEFVHFAIRTIVTCQGCKRRGRRVMTLLEHPEDLGRVKYGLHKGVPASIWQLPELRKAYAEFPFVTVAGHQCRFGVDFPKPTRLLTDILSLAAFGYTGWPSFDENDNYVGPLPRHCGHDNHKAQTIGRVEGGGHATSPMASYPDKMCLYLAFHIFEDWVKNGRGSMSSPVGRGRAGVSSRTHDHSQQPPSSSSMDRRPLTEFSARVARNVAENASVAETQVDRDDGVSDVSIRDLKFGNEIISQDEIRRASEEMDQKGIHRPIREGIDIDEDGMPRLLECDSEDEDTGKGVGDLEGETTDEEAELGGMTRPKKGSGWWGRGPPVRVQRKGVMKGLVDGAGLPSPGRWPPNQRRLPEGEVADGLRKIFMNGLMKSTEHLPGGTLKSALASLISGKVEVDPFPKEIVDEVRMDLRVLLNRAGVGDGAGEMSPQ